MSEDSLEKFLREAVERDAELAREHPDLWREIHESKRLESQFADDPPFRNRPARRWAWWR